jgi:CRP-like cAMP-binding protein
MIKDAIKSNRVLGEVLQLAEAQYERIAEACHMIFIKRDTPLMKQGDRGSTLFILQDGRMDVCYTLEKDQIKGLKGEFKFNAGDSFGELGLLYDATRTATITAASDCHLWVLSRHEFQVVTRMTYASRIGEYADLLKNVPCLKSIVDQQKIDMIAGVVEEVSFLETEDVCTEGQDDGLLFVVFDGECACYKGGELIQTLKKGDWIGEDQLMNDTVQSMTVTVTTDDAVILALDSTSLKMVMNAIEDTELIQQTNDDDFAKRAQAVNSKVAKGIAELSEENFSEKETYRCAERVGALGEGAFGLVFLMQQKSKIPGEAGQYHALKAIRKSHIKEEKCEKMLARERSTMALLESEFIVRLYATFQDQEFVYFCQEPVMCGELFDIYTDHNLFGQFPTARFFMGCVALGLSHMHHRRVIYRDLKLENCLVDEKGYLKLTDMGIAKIVIGKTYTVCGTPDYIAPETLRQVGHNRAVDWWASGVLLFIMACGRSPFDAPEVPMVYKNIIKGFSKVKFPESMPSDVLDTIKSLCRKKPEERVTMQKGGIENLKDMPFFGAINWSSLLDRAMPAPITPPSPDLKKIASKTLERDYTVDMDKVQEWDGGLPADSL